MREYINSDTAVLSTGKVRKNISKATASVAAVATAAGIAASAVPVSAASSDYDYYAEVMYTNAYESSAVISTVYEGICANATNPIAPVAAVEDSAVSGKVYIKPGEALAQEIGIKAGTKIGAVYDINSKNGDISANVKAYANTNPLVALSLVFAGDSAYVGIPTISDGWLTITGDEFMDMIGNMTDMTGANFDTGAANFNPANITILDGTVLTKERTDRIAKKYTDLMLKYSQNVTVEKAQDVEQGGVTQTLDIASVELSGEELYSLCVETIKTLAKDSDIKAIWNSCGLSAEDYTDMLKECAKSISEQKRDILSMTTYLNTAIDQNGAIVGEEVLLYKDEESFAGVQMLNLFDEETGAFSTSGTFVVPSCATTYAFQGASNADGAFNGTGGVHVIVVETDENGIPSEDPEDISEFKLSLKMVDMSDKSGKMFINARADDVTCKARIYAQDNKVYGQVNAYQDDEKLLSMYIDAAEKTPVDVVAPKNNLYKINSEADLTKYLATADFSKLKTNIENARGSLGDEMTDGLTTSIDTLIQIAAMLG